MIRPQMIACAEKDEPPPIHEIVQRAQGGDREAFGELIEHHWKEMYHLSYQILGNDADAEEHTQDCFLHAQRKLDQLKDPKRFSGWMRTIIKRQGINRAIRRKPVLTGHMDEEGTNLFTNLRDELAREPDEQAIRHETIHHLHQALTSLNLIDRRVLTLFYLEDLSLKETAKELSTLEHKEGKGEIPIGTVKRRLHVARKRLAKAMTSKGGASHQLKINN